MIADARKTQSYSRKTAWFPSIYVYSTYSSYLFVFDFNSTMCNRKESRQEKKQKQNNGGSSEWE